MLFLHLETKRLLVFSYLLSSSTLNARVRQGPALHKLHLVRVYNCLLSMQRSLLTAFHHSTGDRIKDLHPLLTLEVVQHQISELSSSKLLIEFARYSIYTGVFNSSKVIGRSRSLIFSSESLGSLKCSKKVSGFVYVHQAL